MPQELDRILERIDAMEQKRPSHKEVLEFLKGIVTEQYEAKEQIKVEPIDIKEDMVKLKTREGFPLVDKKDLKLDMESGTALFKRLCAVVQKRSDEIAGDLKKINEKLDEYNKEIQSLHKQGRYTDAAILIEKGLLLDPTNKYLKELKKLNQKGSDEQMRQELSDDEKMRDLVNIAIKEFIQGNYLESKKYFEKVLAINPDDEKAKNSIEKIDNKISSLNLSQ